MRKTQVEINILSCITDTPLQRSENIPTFAECEEFLNDSELLGEVKDPALDKQLALMDRLVNVIYWLEEN